MGQVSGRGQYSTSHSFETPKPIFLKVEIYNYYKEATHMQTFGGGVVWANSHFDA